MLLFSIEPQHESAIGIQISLPFSQNSIPSKELPTTEIVVVVV